MSVPGRAREHRHLEHGIGDRRVRRAGRGEAHPARRAVAPDDADRGLVADQAAHRRRDADRTAAVGGRREWCEPGRERGRRTSTRSTGRAVVVPRVAGRAEDQVVGVTRSIRTQECSSCPPRSRRRRAVGRRSRRRSPPDSRPRTAGDPYVVGSPATSVRSFTRSGTPASGPLRRVSSSASASSSAASARSRTTAFSSPFAASIRRSDSSTRSRGDTIFSRTAAASCLTPLIAIGQVLQACRPHRLSCSGGPRARARSARHAPRCPGRPACRSRRAAGFRHTTFNGRSEVPSRGRMRTEMAKASGQTSVAVALTTTEVGRAGERSGAIASWRHSSSSASRARISSSTVHCARYARQASSIQRSMTSVRTAPCASSSSADAVCACTTDHFVEISLTGSSVGTRAPARCAISEPGG